LGQTMVLAIDKEGGEIARINKIAEDGTSEMARYVITNGLPSRDTLFKQRQVAVNASSTPDATEAALLDAMRVEDPDELKEMIQSDRYSDTEKLFISSLLKSQIALGMLGREISINRDIAKKEQRTKSNREAIKYARKNR